MKSVSKILVAGAALLISHTLFAQGKNGGRASVNAQAKISAHAADRAAHASQKATQNTARASEKAAHDAAKAAQRASRDGAKATREQARVNGSLNANAHANANAKNHANENSVLIGTTQVTVYG